MLPRQGAIRRLDHLRLSVGDHLQHAVWIDDCQHRVQDREFGRPAQDTLLSELAGIFRSYGVIRFA
jgi:hypothetical protein